MQTKSLQLPEVDFISCLILLLTYIIVGDRDYRKLENNGPEEKQCKYITPVVPNNNGFMNTEAKISSKRLGGTGEGKNLVNAFNNESRYAMPSNLLDYSYKLKQVNKGRIRYLELWIFMLCSLYLYYLIWSMVAIALQPSDLRANLL